MREVHAWSGRPGWPQGMAKLPAATPAPDTLDWDLWLGGAAARPFTAGDDDYMAFVAKRDGKTSYSSPSGFYLPFNWRGFYDFGSSLIGDWGIHILGPANWALQLHPKYLLSVECIKKDSLPPFTFPDELAIRFDFGPRPGMPPVSVYWYQHANGDAYVPPGMTPEEASKIPGQGPQVGPVLPSRPGRGRYNCIFAGSKGYLGTSGRGEGVGLLPGKRWAEYKLPPPYLILALAWDSVHEDGLHITRDIYRNILQTPKTSTSVRTAAISTDIRADLDVWRNRSPDAQPDDWIFPNEKGNKPLAHGNYWRRSIKPTLDDLKITGVTFQALRRTAVTLLNAHGNADASVVAAQCGHGVDVSVNVYNKVGIRRQQEAINQLSIIMASQHPVHSNESATPWKQ